jgi:hypothetical protein
MNSIVFEHVPVAELPEKWRDTVTKAGLATVTVRIEGELAVEPAMDITTGDPAFGIWRDHPDSADVSEYVQRLRDPRYGRDGLRKAR